MEVPCTVTVQLAAFAQNIQVFASVADYDSRPEKTWPAETLLASGAAGLHGYQRGDANPHANEAFIAGIVEASQSFENPLTHGQFQWAQIKVMGGYFDVCIDSSLLSGAVAKGNVVSGNFWLSGRLVFENQ
jgi:hypothetical protein